MLTCIRVYNILVFCLHAKLEQNKTFDETRYHNWNNDGSTYFKKSFSSWFNFLVPQHVKMFIHVDDVVDNLVCEHYAFQLQISTKILV